MNNEDRMSISGLKKVHLYWAPPVALLLMSLLYYYLKALVDTAIGSVSILEPGSHLTDSIGFFIYEVPKVFLLLIAIVFVMGVVRTYFAPERTRKLLGGKRLLAGNVMASGLGIVTPFCTCSAIPLFLGFVEAGVPLGVTFSFLIAAPMINEIAAILLFEMFGWQVALAYIGTGLVIAILSGFIIGKLKIEHWVQDWVYQTRVGQNEVSLKMPFHERIRLGLTAVKDIVGKVWIYILVGIALGAGLHGYVPDDYLAGIMGDQAWYSVPLSILIGIPLYSNAAGIVPVVSVLLEKGASMGTVLAFMMSVIGLSLPELIILKKVLKVKLIALFVGIVAAGIMLTGYLFNFLF